MFGAVGVCGAAHEFAAVGLCGAAHYVWSSGSMWSIALCLKQWVCVKQRIMFGVIIIIIIIILLKQDYKVQLANNKIQMA